MLISTEEKCHIEGPSLRALVRFFWCLCSWRCKNAEWDFKIPRHLTVLEISRSPVLLRHSVPLKYGQGGLESFKAALLEHFMSAYLCCLQDRCLKRWGWTGADVMSLWNSTDCRNHSAGLEQELRSGMRRWRWCWLIPQERNSQHRERSVLRWAFREQGSHKCSATVIWWRWKGIFSVTWDSEAILGPGQLACF